MRKPDKYLLKCRRQVKWKMVLKVCDTHDITCHCLKSEEQGQDEMGKQGQSRVGLLLLTLSQGLNG